MKKYINIDRLINKRKVDMKHKKKYKSKSKNHKLLVFTLILSMFIVGVFANLSMYYGGMI